MCLISSFVLVHSTRVVMLTAATQSRIFLEYSRSGKWRTVAWHINPSNNVPVAFDVVEEAERRYKSWCQKKTRAVVKKGWR